MTTAAETKQKAAPKWWLGWLKLAVTGGLIFIVLRFVPIEDIWTGIQRTNPVIWILVLIGFLLGHVFAAFKWKLLAGGGIDFTTVLRAHFAGLAANLALPGVAGGDVARAGVLARRSTSKQALVIGSIIDRLIDVAVLVLVAALGATLLGTAGITGGWLQGLAIGFVALGAVAYALVPAFSRWAITRLGGDDIGKGRQLLLDLVNYIAVHRTRMLVCAVLSFAIQVSFVGLNVVLAWSMQGPTSIAMWLFAWPLAKLIATLPISIGGLGVREASLAAVFAAFGSPSPIVVAVGFIWQTILISTGLIGLCVQFLSRPRQTESLGNDHAGSDAR